MLLAPLHVLPRPAREAHPKVRSFVVSSAWSATGSTLLQGLLARGGPAYGVDLTSLRTPGRVGDQARRSFIDFLDRMSVAAVLPSTPQDHETLAELARTEHPERFITASPDTLARMRDRSLLAEAFAHAGQAAPDGSHPDVAPYLAVTYRPTAHAGATHVWLYRWADGGHELIVDADLRDELRAPLVDLVAALGVTGVATFGLTLTNDATALVLSAHPGFTQMSAHCPEVSEYLVSRFTEL
ncbi:hypothetical protein [Pseudactinotalea sp. HY158]|uniref:hypothetical protein n=1 Tax=Pseudactinotalea sp. HY158 TaxID=2654547 RepID=UPI00129CD496|nr:hypothetical protein [Pseudactinotalea sp. HY158]QGH69564.1 hypothetical protein GCE65_08595 [Pseudactinotalea sp. HY158]